MKHYELEKDEQQLLDSVEQGEFSPVKNQEVMEKDIVAAAKKSGNTSAQDMGSEFDQAVTEFLDHHDEALKELAKR